MRVYDVSLINQRFPVDKIMIVVTEEDIINETMSFMGNWDILILPRAAKNSHNKFVNQLIWRTKMLANSEIIYV